MEPTIPNVVLRWFINALTVGINFACAFRVAQFLKSKHPKLLTEEKLSILVIVSSAFLLLAGVGKLGWSIQTFGGNTPPEILNLTIFLCLSHLGGFGLFTYLISSAWKKKESQQSKP